MRWRTAIVLLGACCVVLFALLVFKWAPEWLAQPGLEDPARAEDIGRTRTAVLAALAGLIAIAGAVFTGLSYRLNRAGQITERFTRAIDQIGSDKLDIRLGGIYALERIARDSSDDHPQVIEVLNTYVREHAPLSSNASPARDAHERSANVQVEAIRALERIAKGAQTGAVPASAESTTDAATSQAEAPPPTPPTDVQAAMSVLGRRSRGRSEAQLNVARTDLRGLVLRGDPVNLEGANLEGANLEGAVLRTANLQGAELAHAWLPGAELDDAQLERAVLFGVNLANASLRRAKFKGANLFAATLKGAALNDAHLEELDDGRGADFEGAQLLEAHLEKSDLSEACLKNANLYGAHLEKCNLSEACLEGANLYGAHLEGADLSYAHLERAQLYGAHLEGAHLSYAHLEGANLNDATHDHLTNLTDAIYDDHTHALGFDLKAAGAQHADETGDESDSIPGPDQ
jgi:uncharacterized protein YjbI with pentapeptide repeats